MISFECPSCNAKLQVKDEHAGKTIQCPTCKTKVAAPAAEEDAGAIQSAPSAKASPPPTSVTTPENTKSKKARKREDNGDDDDDDRPIRKSGGDDAAKAVAGAGIGIGMILAIVGVVSVCCIVAIAGILVALLVPAVSKVREAAARTESMNNLKQIGLGMHAFHDVNMRMPFNGSDDSPKNAPQLKYSKTAKPGDPLSGSWAFQITPFIEQQGVFNAANRTAPIKTFLCPGRGRPPIETTNGGGAWSDYFYNNYLNDPMLADRPDAPDQRRKLLGIIDGTSNTIFAGHGNVQIKEYKSNGNVLHSTNIFVGGGTGTMRSGNPGVTMPGGVMFARDSENPPGPNSWGGPFPGVALMGFCDGTVRFVAYDFPNLNAALTPTGGEAVMLP